ncbi:MAG TPA: AtpZ/AtpI family protein [Hyphomicrobiaceae bacterium]|nr:AtpZ/AtpI family protein [Hyphomicrobiaceae bacterium]
MSSEGKDGERDRGGISPADRDAFKRRASEIGRRLEEVAARRPVQQDETTRARGQAMGQAFRIVAELVVGVAVGGFIGHTLDRWLGATPWLLVVGLMLGFAAGLMNVIRTARRMQAGAEPMQRAAKPVKDDEDES